MWHKWSFWFFRESIQNPLGDNEVVSRIVALNSSHRAARYLIRLMTFTMDTSWLFYLLTAIFLVQTISYSFQVDSVRISEDRRTNPVYRRQSNGTDLIVSDVNNVNIAFFISDQNELPVDFDILRATLALAAYEVNRRYPHLNFKLVSVRDKNKCQNNVLGALAAEKYYTSKVNAFIGPVCSTALDPVSRMASYWNIPVFTAGGIGVEFSNKKSFTTLTRMSFSLG